MLPILALRPIVSNTRGVGDQLSSIILGIVVLGFLAFVLAPSLLQTAIDFAMTTTGVGVLVVVVLLVVLFMRKPTST